MICPKCGIQNNDLNKMCSNCGELLQNIQNDNRLKGNAENTNNSQFSSFTTINNNNNICKLTLNRPNLFVGRFFTLNVCIDGEFKCKLKNNESVSIDITGGVHHLSFKGYSEYSLQILGDSTATVIVTDRKEILLQDLIGANILQDENDSYNKKKITTATSLVYLSCPILLSSFCFTPFMSNISILLVLIFIEFILALIGIYSTNKQHEKLGFSYKKVLTIYIETIVISIISIILCFALKGYLISR